MASTFLLRATRHASALTIKKAPFAVSSVSSSSSSSSSPCFYSVLAYFKRSPSTPFRLRTAAPSLSAPFLSCRRAFSTEGEKHAAGDAKTEAASEKTTETKEVDLKELLAQKDKILKEKEEKINDYHDRLLRSLAEQENVRARAIKDVDAAKKFAVSKFGESVLEVVDLLSATVKAAEAVDTAGKTKEEMDKLSADLLEGVAMTEKILIKALEKSGVKKFEASGMADPNLHMVMTMMSDPTGTKKDGEIAAVFKDGFMINDRVLRCAQVATYKKQ